VVAGLGAQRSILNCASFQYHGQDLVVGLDGYGQGLALLERFFGYLKANNDGSFPCGSGQQLGFWESAGSELSFKAGNAW